MAASWVLLQLRNSEPNGSSRSPVRRLMRASSSSGNSRTLTEALPGVAACERSSLRLLHPQLRRELSLVVACSTSLGLISLFYCYTHGLLLLYGDAVAHLHIARR